MNFAWVESVIATVPDTAVVVPYTFAVKDAVFTPVTGSENVTVNGPLMDAFEVGAFAMTRGAAVLPLTKERTS